jgi:hypothetical protein
MHNPTCTIPGCTQPSRRRTGGAPCIAHATRIRRNGHPGSPQIAIKGQPKKPCTVFGCAGLITANNMCDKHNQRTARTGDPTILTGPLTGTANPAYKGDQVGYGAAHDRVRRAKGRAADYPCVTCGNPARHWAYNHQDPNEKPPTRSAGGRELGPYSTNPDHYQPMCVPCHHILDA